MTARYLKANLDTGSATAASSVIPIADGGTGTTTQQDAINALTGTQSSGKYLRSDGTNASLSDIQASDVPTLNQNTTGTAANLSGTPALPDGTSATTQTAGDNSTKLATTAYADNAASAAADAVNPMTTLGDIIYGDTGGSPLRLPGNTTGTKKFLSSVGSGGIAGTPAWDELNSTNISDFSGAAQNAIFPALVQSELRYVSPTGNDLAASGGYAAPFQTIAAALVGASPNTTIVLFPGVYTESTVSLPAEVEVRGFGQAATVVSNGFSHTTSGAIPVAIKLVSLNYGTLTVDTSSASSGIVAGRDTIGEIIRTDTNASVLVQFAESTVNGGTLAGSGNTFNECLFIESLEVNSGLTVLENCKIVSRIEASGASTVRMLDCVLFLATEFINGTTVATNTPVWEVDLVTDSLGSYAGTVTKTILADLTSANISDFSDAVQNEVKVVFVGSKADLPAAVGGVITLAANKTYFIEGTIDLTGDRLVASQNTVIIGGSSENCILISTGLSSSTALLSSNWSLPMRNIAITHGTAINLDGTGNAGVAIDWFGVNFVNCATVGTVKTYSNFIMSDCALINSANMTFDGTIATVGFQQCLFSGRAGQTTLNFPSTLTITRRIRATYSSFVAFGGATAINVDTSAVIPVESYILDAINFSGGATYVAGVQHDDNKALFINCKGVNNTASVGQMYFNGNATQNPIATTATFEKIEGTSSASSQNEKFSHSIGRLTYTGGIARQFEVTASCSVNSVTTNSVSISVRIAKNGTTIPESEAKATTSASGRNENFYCQALVTLSQNDYVELFVANQTNANSLLASEMNVLVKASG